MRSPRRRGALDVRPQGAPDLSGERAIVRAGEPLELAPDVCVDECVDVFAPLATTGRVLVASR
jgi:hypothetical protein